MHPVNDERTELALWEALELCDRHLEPNGLPADTAWRDEFEDLAEAVRLALHEDLAAALRSRRRLTLATPRVRHRGGSCRAAGDDVE